MFLSKHCIEKLPKDSFENIHILKKAIFKKFACTVSNETAMRILKDREEGKFEQGVDKV